MITIKTPQEIEILREGGKILASVLNEVAGIIVPGVSTKELDDKAFNLIKKEGGQPSFLHYKPWGSKKKYPASLCVSINDEIVHGIPSAERILKDTDVVSLDLGLEYKKMFTDMAVTFGVGDISTEELRLIDATERSLKLGIAEIKPGSHSGDYGFAVEDYAKKNDFSVVRYLVGHGVGYSVHEDPEIPNWGEKGKGFEFKEGMVLALEPMLCQGSNEVELAKDDWTWKTKDGLLSAHFEHTVAVTKDGVEILTL